MKKRVLVFTVILLFTCLAGFVAAEEHLTDIEELGKSIFFDTDLSINGNQSCAACHAPEVG